jgi:hypothetical protein
MIVEERIYTANVGRAKEWLDYYAEAGFPVQQRHLGKCIGFFTTEIGPLNVIVHLWAYDNLAHRESARAKMAQDPDWHKFVTGGPKGCLLDQESRILNPTSFSPLK